MKENFSTPADASSYGKGCRGGAMPSRVYCALVEADGVCPRRQTAAAHNAAPSIHFDEINFPITRPNGCRPMVPPVTRSSQFSFANWLWAHPEINPRLQRAWSTPFTRVHAASSFGNLSATTLAKAFRLLQRPEGRAPGSAQMRSAAFLFIATMPWARFCAHAVKTVRHFNGLPGFCERRASGRLAAISRPQPRRYFSGKKLARSLAQPGSGQFFSA